MFESVDFIGFIQLATLVAAIAGVAYCFCAPILRNGRVAEQRRQERSTIRAQERAARIRQRRRIIDRYDPDRYAAGGGGAYTKAG